MTVNAKRLPPGHWTRWMSLTSLRATAAPRCSTGARAVLPQGARAVNGERRNRKPSPPATIPAMLRGVSASPALDPRGVLAVVKARRWLIVTAAVLAGLIVFAVSASKPDRYQASAGLLFGQTTTA